VWISLPVQVQAESLVEAQFMVPEALEYISSQELIETSQVFSLTRVPPPGTASIAQLEILDPDSFSIIGSELLPD